MFVALDSVLHAVAYAMLAVCNLLPSLSPGSNPPCYPLLVLLGHQHHLSGLGNRGKPAITMGVTVLLDCEFTCCTACRKPARNSLGPEGVTRVNHALCCLPAYWALNAKDSNFLAPYPTPTLNFLRPKIFLGALALP